MQFKAIFILLATLVAGVLGSPVPADIPCKRTARSLAAVVNVGIDIRGLLAPRTGICSIITV
ncbi:hypothetical protein FKP32DRAFT_1597731 [Trametes sanguinea]|nr:hypothetical protein FKP32DRAFT_1597731 [Trametes sanguinea]